eukprot:scaffold115480_cov42-Phaeocystis_antarctica.AAC.2
MVRPHRREDLPADDRLDSARAARRDRRLRAGHLLRQPAPLAPRHPARSQGRGPARGGGRTRRVFGALRRGGQGGVAPVERQ